jgi:hypothetical protein
MTGPLCRCLRLPERELCVYYSGFYPRQLALLTVGSNLMPMAWWSPISSESLDLMRMSVCP